MIPGRVAHLTDAQPQQSDLGRINCQYRSLCNRGCTYGAYFSSLSATLPAAKNTGNLTIVTDAIAHSLIYDAKRDRVTGVRVIDARTREGRTYEAKLVFLCGSTIPTAQILLNSRSEAFPNGLANSSDAVGRYLMDHLIGMVEGAYPGFTDSYYHGRRPNGYCIPRFRNITPTENYHRGYFLQGITWRSSWDAATVTPMGVGAEIKARLRKPGPWMILAAIFGEMLPDRNNRVTLHPSQTDKWGIPLARIECSHGENEKRLYAAAEADAVEMLQAAGATVTTRTMQPATPGLAIHEMGTAHMGADPKTSVLNEYSQAHDVPNLFVGDGSAMASSGCQNPSLTYMALAARAANYAADFLREGRI